MAKSLLSLLVVGLLQSITVASQSNFYCAELRLIDCEIGITNLVWYSSMVVRQYYGSDTLYRSINLQQLQQQQQQ